MDSETFGTVKWFSRMKGWGFIEPDGGDRDVFVHYENIAGEGFRNLEKGERVRFRIEDTPKGPKAMEVFPVEMSIIEDTPKDPEVMEASPTEMPIEF